MKIVNKRYGLARTAEEIEYYLLHNNIIGRDIYIRWLNISPQKRNGFRSALRRIIKHYILGEEFQLALAKDILNDGNIRVEGYLFKHLKSRLYNGDTRHLLSDLQEIVNNG